MITTTTHTVNQTPAYKRNAGLPLDPDVEVTVSVIFGVIEQIIVDPHEHDFPLVVIDGDSIRVADLTYWEGSQWVGAPAVGDRVTATVEPLPGGGWLAGGLDRAVQA